MSLSRSHMRRHAIFFVACFALLFIVTCAALLLNMPTAVLEEQGIQSRTYTPTELKYKERLAGTWFIPYTAEDCALVLTEGNMSSCVPGIDGHTLVFLPERNADVLFDSVRTSNEYECGWNVRSSKVFTVCGVPLEEFPAFTIQSIDAYELVLTYEDDFQTLVKYRKISEIQQ